MKSVPLIALDTNVVVSAQINPFGAPGRIWDRVTGRQLRLAYDDRILLEYESVLRRVKFKFLSAHVDAILTIFQFQEMVSTMPWTFLPLPDPSDAMFLEVAFSTHCPLVTGNIRHYPEDKRGGIKVYTPDEWLANIDS